MLGFVCLRRRRALPAGGEPAPQRSGPAHARRALERARGRRGGDQRPQHEVRGLRDLLVHRGLAGTFYAYSLGSVSAERFGILIALGFVAFAYVGGITMVSGAVFGGLIATSGLIPHLFEDELGSRAPGRCSWPA